MLTFQSHGSLDARRARVLPRRPLLVFGPFLDSVARDLGHYYTVAYRVAPELRFRRLEVRPKNSAWVVRHRDAAVPDDRPPGADRRP